MSNNLSQGSYVIYLFVCQKTYEADCHDTWCYGGASGRGRGRAPFMLVQNLCSFSLTLQYRSFCKAHCTLRKYHMDIYEKNTGFRV